MQMTIRGLIKVVSSALVVGLVLPACGAAPDQSGTDPAATGAKADDVSSVQQAAYTGAPGRNNRCVATCQAIAAAGCGLTLDQCVQFICDSHPAGTCQSEYARYAACANTAKTVDCSNGIYPACIPQLTALQTCIQP